MNTLWLSFILVSIFLWSTHAHPTSHILRVLGPQGVNLWSLQKSKAPSIPHGLTAQQGFTYSDSDRETISGFHTQWFRQPLDHFSSHSNHTFLQRFWVNTRHYRPGFGGPVIVLDGGETSGEDRISFLDTGIAEILARATGGIGVVLEHRYYGRSIPVSNFTTDSLRWLNNNQSAADSANFMANVKFEGVDEDLTAPSTPWIYYGGSYAGARAAHMKILYPELVYGAIASSAVTHASLENWEYMETIRIAAPPKCSSNLENSIKTIDSILARRRFTRPLKSLFGLGGLKHDEDFVSVIETPLSFWQAKCWDPTVGSTAFDDFCAALNKPPFGLGINENLFYGDARRTVQVPGGLSVDFTILNYANYIKKNVVSLCPEEMSTEDCFGTFDDSKFQDTSTDQEWRLWLFQVCTEWGYFTTAPPNQNQPRIVSRLLTLEYESKICKQAFPAGKYFAVPSMPNITAVNVLGDFDIAADRLAIIDGEVDPWKPNTPHSYYANDREDSVLRPFKIIPNGVHHYDEYGLRNIFDEPPEIHQIHGEMIMFVMEWLKDWEPPRS